MNLFGDLFRTKKDETESVILIDIGATEISGAYVRYAEGEQPVLYYTRRIPIEIHGDEPHERVMLHTLAALGNDLIRSGAPVLARATGSGSASRILVSIGAPWQETSVRTEHFEETDPFTFTKNLVEKRLKETQLAPSAKVLADTSIIGTILNGYETHAPYGKSVHRAAVIILTSLIEENVAKGIATILSGLFHTKNILTIADNSLRYQAMRSTFPHERDAIILDATGETHTSIALVRKGSFVTMFGTTTPIDDEQWVTKVIEELAALAKLFPLPRIIFLLAREREEGVLEGKLEKANLKNLWLSDNPPKIVLVLKSHLASTVRHLATEAPSLVLLLMTLYFQNRRREQGEAT